MDMYMHMIQDVCARRNNQIVYKLRLQVEVSLHCIAFCLSVLLMIFDVLKSNKFVRLYLLDDITFYTIIKGLICSIIARFLYFLHR